MPQNLKKNLPLLVGPPAFWVDDVPNFPKWEFWDMWSLPGGYFTLCIVKAFKTMVAYESDLRPWKKNVKKKLPMLWNTRLRLHTKGFFETNRIFAAPTFWPDAAPLRNLLVVSPLGWFGRSTYQLSLMTSRSSTWRIGPQDLDPQLGSPNVGSSAIQASVNGSAGGWILVIDSTPDSDHPGLVRKQGI